MGIREPDDAFSFQAPATRASVRWCRAFTGAAIRACEIDPDTAADLALAVSELASLIVDGAAEGSLDIRGAVDDGVLTIEVGQWPANGLDIIESDTWDLVTALFDTVEVRGRAVVVTAVPSPGPSPGSPADE